MIFKRLPKCLDLYVGAICGPTFAIIDGHQLNHEEVCYGQILEGVPENILNVSQVMMLSTPEQLRNHVVCSNQACNLKSINLETIPKDHFILRTWFPDFNYRSGKWREASISVGGLMTAGKYLHQYRHEVSPPWRFAFWCQETNCWETFEVLPQGDRFVRVRFARENFQAAQEVYDQSQKVLEAYFLDKQKEEFTHLLPKISPSSMSDHLVDLAVIQARYGTNMDYEEPQIVPFIPVFVGELHYVVPIGEFLRKSLGREIGGTSLQPYMRICEELYQLFGGWDSLRDFLHNIGVIRDWWEKSFFDNESASFMRRYPGGWTFLKDEERNISPYIEFVTLEPEYPIHPFSNSGSGALAAAIVQNILHPDDKEITYHMKGWTLNMEKTWVERAFRYSTIDIRKSEGGMWEACAPVRMLGKYTCTGDDLKFVKDGR